MQLSKFHNPANQTIEPSTGHRLTFTLVIALIFHAMLTIGINPTITETAKRSPSPIEVRLVHEHANEPHDQPLLQENTGVKYTPTSESIPSTEKITQSEKQAVPTLKIPIAKQSPLVPNAKQLINRALAMASATSEIQSELQSNEPKIRHKYISVNTKDYKYAAYMEAWRAKVERIGNINYPNKAREKELSGNLSLDVSLRQDGTVKEINIRRSSGHDVLDEAAIEIVKLAAPFAPFPTAIKKEVDILHVTRTWKFVNDENFSTQ
jgi:TonB family protein